MRVTQSIIIQDCKARMLPCGELQKSMLNVHLNFYFCVLFFNSVKVIYLEWLHDSLKVKTQIFDCTKSLSPDNSLKNASSSSNSS